jgi:hypothetical protein
MILRWSDVRGENVSRHITVLISGPAVLSKQVSSGKNKLLIYTTRLGTKNKPVDLQSGGVSFEFQALLLGDSVTFV